MPLGPKVSVSCIKSQKLFYIGKVANDAYKIVIFLITVQFFERKFRFFSKRFTFVRMPTITVAFMFS